jgi:hypothetical protein
VATTRSAHTIWEGDLLKGNGVVTFDSSGAIGQQPVTWASRAEEAKVGCPVSQALKAVPITLSAKLA